MADEPPVRSRRTSRNDIEQNRQLLNVAKAVASTLGGNFFRALTEHLANALGVDCVYVAELTSYPFSRLRTVSVYRSGAAPEQFEQELSASAANQVLIDGLVGWSKDVRMIFPLDPVLEDLGAEGYVGVRLRDSSGQVIGLISVVSSQRIKSMPLTKSVLEAFAPRAAAELERHRAEKALRESEERYRAFISSSSDAMWRIEFERPISVLASEEDQIEGIYQYGYIAECNAALATLVGSRNAAELVGTPFSVLFPPTDHRIREELRSAARSGYSSSTYATTPIGPDGKKQYRLRTLCGIIEDNGLRRIWGTTRDITELKKAELAVEASERRFREVLEHIQAPAMMLAETGAINFCNDSLVQLARSSSRKELTGKKWLDLLEPSGQRETWAALLAAPAASEALGGHFEGVTHLLGAEPRLLLWDTIALRNETGDPAGIAAIGRDITDQKALETHLARVEKLESIGHLAAGIAHDFNNFLTLLMGYVELALEQVDPVLPVHKTLTTLQSVTSQCMDLAEQLLTIGRKQHLRPQLIALNSLILGEETMIRSMIGDRIALVTELDPALGLVYADPVQVRRILANLVTNARDAMANGGTLIIATTNVDLGPGFTDAPADLPRRPYVRLIVTDTGTGLSDVVKQHMFEPFITTKAPRKGTGLGLPTVYGIVTQSGGFILVRSAAGAGTTIEILLPRHRRAD